MTAKAPGRGNGFDGPTAFADDADNPAWAKGAVEAQRFDRIIHGRGGGRFAPHDIATRAGAASMLLRIRKAR